MRMILTVAHLDDNCGRLRPLKDFTVTIYVKLNTVFRKIQEKRK